MNPDGAITFDPGSFKDPDGGVFYQGGRVYRYFTPRGAARFRSMAKSGLLDPLIAEGAVMETREVSLGEVPGLLQVIPGAAFVVEHPRLPFISYCYEWPFEMLKAAALCHLEVLRVALDKGFILKDATPYNVQFIGSQPIFIDVASIEPYTEGQPWDAYNQFCRLFLNPLLLQALTGVRFQQWLRGALNGIAPAELGRVLSWRQKLRPSVFPHVVLQAWLERTFASKGSVGFDPQQQTIPRKQILRLINKITATIERLKPGKPNSHWMGYDDENSYSLEGQSDKEAFVERFLAAQKPKVVWDLGCNTGRYSAIAARHTNHVIAIDSDPDTVDLLYREARESASNILPLVVDLLDPSPERGWAQAERSGLLKRGPADVALCLALVHHLAITGNVPLQNVVSWLARVARSGVVEFVPKEDPMIQVLLRFRRDVYDGYTQATFEAALREHFQINEQCTLPGSGRTLYSFVKPSL